MKKAQAQKPVLVRSLISLCEEGGKIVTQFLDSRATINHIAAEFKREYQEVADELAFGGLFRMSNGRYFKVRECSLSGS